MHKNVVVRKGLVVGIIVLFIGIAVAPGINAINIVKSNVIQETVDSSVIEIFDIEDDCGCQPVSNLNLVRFERLSNRLEKLSNKLEIYTNIVSILSKNNLVIAEKYKDSSNEIVTITELNEELKTDIIFQDSSFICDILVTIFNNVEEILYYYGKSY